jgi:hypothetical protein
MILSCKNNMHSRVLKYKISCPFLTMLAILVNTCKVHVLQVSNDPMGHIALGDSWFEVFKSNICCWTVTTRLGEQIAH